MKRAIAIFVVIGFAIVGLIGCGVSQEKYNVLQKDKKALETKISELTNEKAMLKMELGKLGRDNAAIKAAYDKLTTEKSVLDVEIERLKNEKAALQEKMPISPVKP